MSWFRLDDQAAFHAKLVAAGNAAVGAWARMGMWSSAQLTDGFIPERIALVIASPEEIASCLGAVLLERAEGGYQVHDFLDYNPSKESVIAEREAKREGGRKTANLRWGASAGAVAPPIAPAKAPATAGASTGAMGGPTGGSMLPTRPVPSRPDPEETGESAPPSNPAGQLGLVRDPNKPKRPDPKGTRLPEGWRPSPAAVEAFRRDGLDVEPVIPRFVDYWIAQPGARGRKADWEATFRNWVRRDDEKGLVPACEAPALQPELTPPGFVPATAEQRAAAVARINANLEAAARRSRPNDLVATLPQIETAKA